MIHNAMGVPDFTIASAIISICPSLVIIAWREWPKPACSSAGALFAKRQSQHQTEHQLQQKPFLACLYSWLMPEDGLNAVIQRHT